MHGIVHVAGSVDHQSRRLGHAFITGSGLLLDDQTEAADRGDGLSEFVMQFAGDRAPLLFDVALDHLREFAVFPQAIAGLIGGAPVRHAVRHRLRGAVECGAHQAALAAAQGRQSGTIIPCFHAFESLDDDLQRPQDAPGKPEHRKIDEREGDRADPQQLQQTVPAIQNGAR